MSRVKQLRSMFLAPIVVLACYLIFTEPYSARTPEEAVGFAQSPQILVKTQVGAPLSISSVRSDSATTHMPELVVFVTNTSNQAIRAYAIRYETIEGQSKSGGMEMANKESLSSVLQPSKSE